MAEYTILGFLAARAIFSLKLRSSDGFVFALSVMFCILYGLSDEIHQSFTPGRSPNLGDVMADGVGALMGAMMYWGLMTYVGKASSIQQKPDREQLITVQASGVEKRR